MNFFQKKDWRIEGNRRYLRGDYHSAINFYNKAIEEHSVNYEAFFNKGMAYHDLGMYRKAIEDFTTAISINSNFSEAYKNRALSYYALNENKKALEDYNTSIMLNE